ncbi:AAA domain-containing protein [Streptomyces sp. SID3343]|uniref:AAA domain-containing protein n=1 Tax=Streptomyces sp. SID3343 TaxID=2690260 RepID=UPI001368F87B|nr:AAA domain-containing protein [Streptomyces sp. SID3343]MYW03323.1 AAA family ATPase [Streptomyces sp. SID3343]MYW04722.1 AAA family ATPase [Streptomyces sp. SID3343]
MSGNPGGEGILGPLPGRPLFVELSGPVSQPLPPDPVGREVVLTRDATIVSAWLPHANGGPSWPVRPRGAADAELLHRLVRETSATVAVVYSHEEGDRPKHSWLRVRAHVFDTTRHWPTRMTIGLDDRMIDVLRRVTKGGARDGAGTGVPALLRERVSLPALPGGPAPCRFFVLARPGQELSEPEAGRLVGGGLVVDLARAELGWRVTGIRRHDMLPQDGQRLVLVHGDLDFTDASVGALLRERMRGELRRLEAGERDDSFLARWREYQNLEDRYALGRVREFGCLEYAYCERVDGSPELLRFRLDVEGEGGARQRAMLRHLAESVEAGEEFELECARDRPDGLDGTHPGGAFADDRGLLSLPVGRGEDVGVVVAVDEPEGTVDLRSTDRERRVAGVGPSLARALPAAPGFLYAATAGDRRRLERRRKALDRVLREDIPLPQLLPLLQGQSVRGREHPPIREYSPAAWACFKGEPTPAQRLALETALNTPDVAVIQGPPGTGKTQLIAALQVRLAEQGKAHAVVSRSMLLTSFQHAAVDNLVERSKVWNLPAIKVDSRDRGSMEHVAAWRFETLNALEAELEGSLGGRLTLALREVARQASEYALAPVAVEELPALLERVVTRVRGLCSDSLVEQLEDLRTDLDVLRRTARLQVDPTRESTLRAVRGLRDVPAAFADDGPLTAAVALARLRRVDAIDPAHVDVVRRAAEAPEGIVPSFLAELAEVRAALLDRLVPTRRLVEPYPRADVLGLLDTVVAELEDRVRDGDEGVDRALADYLEDLRGDPQAVLHTLRLYTTSLAATCQQADSRGVAGAKEVSSGPVRFDTVIVDEAARANPLDLLIPLTMATRRIVLVGDHRQLPHMLEPDIERELRDRERTDELDTLRRSVFEQLYRLLARDPKAPRAVRLDTQFRMHRTLGDFVGRNFYDGALASPKPDSAFAHGLPGYADRPAAWLRVPGEAGREVAGRSKSRPVEAKRIAAELKRLTTDRPDLTFGVISFYAAQVRLLWHELVAVGLAVRSGRGYRPVEALLRDANGAERTRLLVGTVDAFQGKEFDVSFLSVTRSSAISPDKAAAREPDHARHSAYVEWVRRAYGHLTLRNRMCVALSRQQRLLVVAGDDAMFRPDVAPPEVAALTDFLSMCQGDDGVLLPIDGSARGR